MTFDPRTEANIATLHPKAQKKAREFMSAAVPIMEQRGAVVKIIGGTRTYAEQNALYAQGRTASGPIVTRAKAGYSNHNFGVAWDIGIFSNGKYLEDSPLYRECGKIGESLGLEWGGNWKFQDQPHFQVATGLNLAQMREKIADGKDIFA
jgi:peptidoglycan LD-endopeptidase CwlK